MGIIQINKKKLYEKVLEIVLDDENYEVAATIRDILNNTTDDEIIEVEDGSEIKLEENGN